MDVQAYIESGILQDYCLGLLDPGQMATVEEQAALHPGIKKELEACRKALEEYAQSLARPVPGEVKNKALALFNKLAEE